MLGKEGHNLNKSAKESAIIHFGVFVLLRMILN
jgi:hypothetical protein